MEKKIPVTTDVKNLRHFNIYNKSTVQFEPTFVSTGRQIEAIANTKPNEIAIIEINKELARKRQEFGMAYTPISFNQK